MTSQKLYGLLSKLGTQVSTLQRITSFSSSFSFSSLQRSKTITKVQQLVMKTHIVFRVVDSTNLVPAATFVKDAIMQVTTTDFVNTNFMKDAPFAEHGIYVQGVDAQVTAREYIVTINMNPIYNMTTRAFVEMYLSLCFHQLMRHGHILADKLLGSTKVYIKLGKPEFMWI